MVARSGIALAVLLACGAAFTQPAPAQTGDPAEPAMDAYVTCLNKRFEALKGSCESADLVATAVTTGCLAEQANLERAIAPAFRLFEEMKLAMLSIQQAQTRRMLTHLVEYRVATGACAARPPAAVPPAAPRP